MEGEIEQDLRKILVEMVITPDIEFPCTVVPADVEPEFQLLEFCLSRTHLYQTPVEGVL